MTDIRYSPCFPHVHCHPPASPAKANMTGTRRVMDGHGTRNAWVFTAFVLSGSLLEPTLFLSLSLYIYCYNITYYIYIYIYSCCLFLTPSRVPARIPPAFAMPSPALAAADLCRLASGERGWCRSETTAWSIGVPFMESLLGSAAAWLRGSVIWKNDQWEETEKMYM